MQTTNEIHMLIGGLSDDAVMIGQFLKNRGIKAENVERNPLSIQYSAFINPPDAVLISSKTKYLKQLCKNFRSISNPPYILLIYENENYFDKSHINELSDVVISNQKDAEKVYNGLMKCIMSGGQRKKLPQAVPTVSIPEKNTAETDIALHNKITEILAKLCITPNYNGYNYIRESIKLAVAESDVIKCISKQIYPDVAKKLGTTVSGVERSIRTAIHRSWGKVNISDKVEIFGTYALQDSWIPTNSEYIFIIAERLNCRIKEKETEMYQIQI